MTRYQPSNNWPASLTKSGGGPTSLARRILTTLGEKPRRFRPSPSSSFSKSESLFHQPEFDSDNFSTEILSKDDIHEPAMRRNSSVSLSSSLSPPSPSALLGTSRLRPLSAQFFPAPSVPVVTPNPATEGSFLLSFFVSFFLSVCLCRPKSRFEGNSK